LQKPHNSKFRPIFIPNKNRSAEINYSTERFSFRKASTQKEAAKYGVHSATFTARKPG